MFAKKYNRKLWHISCWEILRKNDPRIFHVEILNPHGGPVLVKGSRFDKEQLIPHKSSCIYQLGSCKEHPCTRIYNKYNIRYG